MYCAVSIELDPTGYTNWSLSEEPLESAVSVSALVDLVREVKEYTSSIAGGKEVLGMNHRVRSCAVYDSTLILNYGRLSFILISLYCQNIPDKICPWFIEKSVFLLFQTLNWNLLLVCSRLNWPQGLPQTFTGIYELGQIFGSSKIF